MWSGSQDASNHTHLQQHRTEDTPGYEISHSVTPPLCCASGATGLVGEDVKMVIEMGARWCMYYGTLRCSSRGY